MPTTTTLPHDVRDYLRRQGLPPPMVVPSESNWFGAHHLLSIDEAAMYLNTDADAVRDLLAAGAVTLIDGATHAGIPVWQLEPPMKRT